MGSCLTRIDESLLDRQRYGSNLPNFNDLDENDLNDTTEYFNDDDGLNLAINRWILDGERLINNASFPEMPIEIRRLIELTKSDLGWLRVIKSMINVVGFQSGKRLESDPVGPNLITVLLEDSMIPTAETICHLLSIIDPYLLERVHNPDDELLVKHRNICTILSFLAEKLAGPMSIKLLSENVLRCIDTILKEKLNYIHVLFALISLEKFALTSDNKERIMKYMDIHKYLHDLEKLYDQYSLKNLYRASQLDLVKFQVGFVAQWCADNVFVKKGRKLAYKNVDYSNLNVILNDNDKSENLKLSPNGLVARSDTCTFECVRANYHASIGVYFYEVICITNGIMQIGWSTDQMEFMNYEGIGVGDDEHSIAFDGCRGIIWHRSFQYKHDFNRWKPGDVLGCLIDDENQRFAFYLNGREFVVTKKIAQKLNVIFEGPYYPAASLMAFQMCHFNFGQEPFKYPPKGYKYKVFNKEVCFENKDTIKVMPMHVKLKSVKNCSFESKKDLCVICYDQQAQVRLKPCDHEKLCIQCVSQISQCPFCRIDFCTFEKI